MQVSIRAECTFTDTSTDTKRARPARLARGRRPHTPTSHAIDHGCDHLCLLGVELE